MKFDELIELAQANRLGISSGAILARAVIDLLGESQPCGFEAPVVDPAMVSIMDGDEPCYQFTPYEARSFAAMILRAADEAEEMEKERTDDHT